MEKDKYAHSFWGMYVKNSVGKEVLYDFNASKMFIPGSTCKLFTTAALLNAYGDEYRFNTPIYAVGTIDGDLLTGNLVLVGKGDLIFGGRQEGADKIEYTSMDHVYADILPDAVLTKQNPLQAINALAKQIHKQGIARVDGDILIDDRLFEAFEERGTIISPIMINENLIDVTLKPSAIGQKVDFEWRPQVPGYSVDNQVVTAGKDEKLEIELIADKENKNFIVKGRLPIGTQNVVRTFPIKDPNHFVRMAMLQALEAEGIVVNMPKLQASLPSEEKLKELTAIASWQSPPLSEYVKLILKVSQNTGANLATVLLAVKSGGKTFNEGLMQLGKFVTQEVGIDRNEIVFLDGAGGDSNRATPQALVKLLAYMRSKPEGQFQKYMNALPILGVNGSLENVGKNAAAKGKVYAKTGTGVSYNPALEQFYLNAQTLAGYIVTKDGEIWEYAIAVNNAEMPTIDDIFPIFDDFGEISNLIYQAINLRE